MLGCINSVNMGIQINKTSRLMDGFVLICSVPVRLDVVNVFHKSFLLSLLHLVLSFPIVLDCCFSLQQDVVFVMLC